MIRIISHFNGLSETLSFEPSKLKRMPLHKEPTFEKLSMAQKLDVFLNQVCMINFSGHVKIFNCLNVLFGQFTPNFILYKLGQ